MTTPTAAFTLPPHPLFRVPTHVTYGFGCSKEVGAAAAQFGRRVLLVTDQGVVKAGLLAAIRRSLGEADCSVTIFDAVEANPSIETVERGFAIYQDCQPDVIVAVGGGSPMDTAKAIGVLATNGGHILDYEGPRPVPIMAAPLIAVPTTAGTASEVTGNAVITDKKRRFKFGISSPNNTFRLAFVDPELTLTKPKGVTAATGMDALTHAVECYTNKIENPIADVLAIEAVRLIGLHLRAAVHEPSNRAGRDGMLLASLLAGMAFTTGRLGNVHAMAHPLGGYFDIPHGVANAILLPHVSAFNAPAAPEKYAKVAAALGEDIAGLTTAEAANRAVEAIRRLGADVGIPPTLREVGADASEIPNMAKDTLLSANIHINPRLATYDDIVALYHAAL